LQITIVSKHSEESPKQLSFEEEVKEEPSVYQGSDKIGTLIEDSDPDYHVTILFNRLMPEFQRNLEPLRMMLEYSNIVFTITLPAKDSKLDVDIFPSCIINDKLHVSKVAFRALGLELGYYFVDDAMKVHDCDVLVGVYTDFYVYNAKAVH